MKTKESLNENLNYTLTVMHIRLSVFYVQRIQVSQSAVKKIA
jgi:hypothetical protein